MFKPLYLIGPPLLLCVAVPLAIFALITSALAFSTLIVRASVVYLELGFALVRSWIVVEVPPIKLPRQQIRSRSPIQTQTRLKKHRKSSSTTSFMQEYAAGRKTPTKNDSVTSFTMSPGPSRDFEGVGGWRLIADNEEDAIWIRMNSRLELPAERPRKHIRSLTSNSQRFAHSPDAIRQSPAESRVRTPPVFEGNSSEGYFGYQTFDEFGVFAEETAAKNRMEERRKSIGSVGSTGSNNSTLTLKNTR